MLHELWEKACIEADVSEFEQIILQKHLNRDIIITALLNFIIVLNLSFRIVEREEFHLLCQALNLESKSFVPSAHSEIYAKLITSFESEKDLVRKKLQSAISVLHISVDIWTTPNFYSCLAVCCSFVDREEQRLSPLIALREVESHSGEDQWKALLPVLQDYGIVCKLGTLIGDNSTTNDTLCRAISQYLEEEEGIKWDPAHQRIRCQGHIINLAVQAFIFAELWDDEELKRMDAVDNIQLQLEAELDPKSSAKANFDSWKGAFRDIGALGQLHNIIVHSRSSTARLKQFETLVGRKIPLDNRTRWNSWWTMLDVALKHEPGIDQYTKAHRDALSEDFLQPQHWENLRMIRDFLEPFNSATLKLQGDQSTLGNVLLTMDVLIRHMEKSLKQPKLNKDLKYRIQKAWEKFDEYYQKTDTSPYYAAALILHPSWRTSYIKQVWKKDWQKPALQSAKALWERFRDLKHHHINTTKGFEARINTQEAPKEMNEFDRIEKELKDRIIRPKSRDEYEDYCHEAPYDIPFTPLQWWMQEQQRKRYPRLSTFAINILSIPAMNDEPERVFSGGRRTMRWDRMRLSVDTLEKTECKKSWAKTGVLKEVN